jgi:hypothetical protein
MYFPNYDPSLHDVYLYDPSNTGLPIGLNPNCILYDCRNCYSSISIRSRAFNIQIKPVPPGTPTSLLPNYYNANSPLFKSKSEKIITVALHYMANKPSDNKSGGQLAKYTGFSGPNPITSVSFWKPDFSGFTSYGPWTSSYNCVPLEDAPETVGLQIPIYFSGSPEVPGFGLGATFYKIASTDYGFMELLDENQEMVQTKFQNIHPYSLLTDYQKNNLSDYVIPSANNNTSIITYFVPVTDVYVWDGNDKIVPVDYIEFFFDKTLPSSLQDAVEKSLTYVIAYVAGATIAVGDSSSPFIYKSGNTFYEFGQGYGTNSKTYNGITYGGIGGPVTSGSFYPSYEFLKNKNLNENHYRISNTNDVILATNGIFTNVNNLLSQIVSQAQNKYNEVSG